MFIFLYCIVCNFMCEHVNMGRSKSAPDSLTLVAGPILRRTTGFTSREQGFRDQGFLTSISQLTVCRLLNNHIHTTNNSILHFSCNCTDAILHAGYCMVYLSSVLYSVGRQNENHVLIKFPTHPSTFC